MLWSDPVAEPGLQINEARGVGLTFGPDVTQVGTFSGSERYYTFKHCVIDPLAHLGSFPSPIITPYHPIISLRLSRPELLGAQLAVAHHPIA